MIPLNYVRPLDEFLLYLYELNLNPFSPSNSSSVMTHMGEQEKRQESTQIIYGKTRRLK